MSLGRPPLPSFGRLNLDGPPPSPPPISDRLPTALAPKNWEQQVLDQLRVMSQMLVDSAHEDSLARQANRDEMRDYNTKLLKTAKEDLA